MENGKEDERSVLWPLSVHHYLAPAYYFKLHTELTLLAFLYIGEMEEAKEVASECLIGCWQTACDEGTTVSVYPYLLNRLLMLCKQSQREGDLRRWSEHHYLFERENLIPAHQKLRIWDREAILHLSRLLAPLEQDVISLIIRDELDLPEISRIIGKPVPSIKIIRDRAVHQLKKLL